MRRSLEFRPDARQEFDDAADWYEAQSPGLRATFVHAVDDALLKIAESPLAFPVVHDSKVHRATVRKFPYIVLFEFDEDGGILVLAIFHTSRDPLNWQARSRA